ncbi:MAG: TolC family protein [candidate division Zixibacteria bacterium]|nr:TolC family protein [candidate division Zixibacteria bacterium]
MRLTFRLGLAALVIFMLAVNVSAETYTLEKCVETALQNNYGVLAAKNSYDATKWQVYSAYAQVLPAVSTGVYSSENWNPPFFFWEGSRTPHPNPGISKTYGGSIQFRKTFPGLGMYDYANIKYNKANRRSAFYDYVSSEKELVYSIKESYFNLIKAKMLVDVSKDAVKRGEEQLKVAQSRYDLGSASLSDVLKAKVLRSNAKLELITADNNVALSKAQLSYSMGIDVIEEIEIVEDFPKTDFDIEYNNALNEALSNNPSYRKSGFDLTKAKASLCMAKANFLPSLSLSLNHRTTVGTSDVLFDFQQEYAGRTFYFELGYNIFNNLSDASNVITGKKNVNSQKETLENARNSVALEVKQTFLDVQQNTEKLNLNEESVAAAQEDLNIVREKYNLGAATIIEVLDAEVSFKEAQINQVQALFDYNLAISRLEKVMGR